MHTEIITLNSEAIDSKLLNRAAAILKSGGLVAFPTETVYGLGANALDADAVAKIFLAKGRPSTNPIIVHVHDIQSAIALVSTWTNTAQLLADRFWPGPLSLAMPKTEHIPDIVTAGGPTVAIRIPSHPVARALIELAGVPIAAPSANLSMEISPTRASHVLKSLDGKIDTIVDGGPCPGGIESTVLTLATDPPTLLRAGLITQRAIEAVIGTIQTSHIGIGMIAQSPGMMDRHYAPRAGLEISGASSLDRVRELSNAGLRIGWMKLGNTSSDNSTGMTIEMPTDSTGYAARLYAVLHEMDEAGVDRIVVEMPPNGDDWTGILDRLTRAKH